MSGSRLGGRSRKLCQPCADVSKLHVIHIPTMTQALRKSERHIWKGASNRDDACAEWVGDKPVDGDKARLAAAVDASEALVNEAIQYDQRLAKKALWLRRDDGEHCDSALLAEGDDQPFYKRFKNIVNDETRAGEPVRIVVSTDDRNIKPGTAAAFIATVPIVQQFIPVEVWWQGAWLSEDRRKGFVMHVPLVQGDMDFSRLEFCIADDCRDTFSFRVMSSICVLELQELWNDCGYRAEISYLPGARGSKHFIAHSGISPTKESIAATAVSWLGWNQLYELKWEEEKNATSAEQSLPVASPAYVDNRSKAERDAAQRDYDEYVRQQKQREAIEAGSRLA